MFHTKVQSINMCHNQQMSAIKKLITTFDRAGGIIHPGSFFHSLNFKAGTS